MLTRTFFLLLQHMLAGVQFVLCRGFLFAQLVLFRGLRARLGDSFAFVLHLGCFAFSLFELEHHPFLLVHLLSLLFLHACS